MYNNIVQFVFVVLRKFEAVTSLVQAAQLIQYSEETAGSTAENSEIQSVHTGF